MNDEAVEMDGTISATRSCERVIKERASSPNARDTTSRFRSQRKHGPIWQVGRRTPDAPRTPA